MSSGQAPVTDFPEATGIDTDDPFLIQVIAPIESETADEAVRRAQDAATEAISGVVATIQGDASAAGNTLGKLEDRLEDRLSSAANLGDVADENAALANLNGLDRRILVKAGAPSTTDVPAGTVRVAKDAATGRLTIWANDGGTMVDLLIL